MFDDSQYDRIMIKNLLDDLASSQNPIETLEKYETLTGTSYLLSSLFEMIDLNSPPESFQLPSFLKGVQTACKTLLENSPPHLSFHSKPPILSLTHNASHIDIHSKSGGNSLELYECCVTAIWSEDSTQPSSFSSPVSRSRNTLISLREISSKVHQIMRAKPTNDPVAIADQIVKELGETEVNIKKNIKRRAYDAINVMLAAGVVQKDGKSLYTVRSDENDVLREKRRMLRNLIETFSAYKNLLWRNSENFKRNEIITLPVMIYKLTGTCSYSMHNIAERCLVNVKSSQKIKSISEIEILKAIDFKNKSRVVPQEVYNLIR